LNLALTGNHGWWRNPSSFISMRIMAIMKTCLSSVQFSIPSHLHARVVARKTLTKPYLTSAATSARGAKNLAQTLPL